MKSCMDFRRAKAAEKLGTGVSKSCARERAVHQQGQPAPTDMGPAGQCIPGHGTRHGPSRHAAPMDTTSALEHPFGHGPNFETEMGILILEMKRLARKTPLFHVLQGNVCM